MLHELKDGYVKVDTDGGITTIEFFNPQNNSLPFSILEELAHEIQIAGDNATTKVIVLRSSGDSVFCSGTSLEEMIAIPNEKAGKDFFTGFAHVINAIRKCPKIVIGRVQGACVGGGVGIAAAVDYCIAWEKAEIKLSEIASGIGPFVIGPAIERKIGLSAYSQLAIDSTMWRNADWAKRKGLFAEVHENIVNMDESINRLATTLAHSHTQALTELKKTLWKGTENWDELLKEYSTITGKLVVTTFSKEALKKLASKLH